MSICIITLKALEDLNPCKDRLENYKKFYADKSFTPRQFMGLKNISASDKEWVGFRCITKEKIKFAAADIAESVLSIYEIAYPNDDRPRKAIAAARNGDKSDASYAASYAASACTGSDRSVQEKINRTIILRYWK